ncbi:alpha/beta hydrolase family protein [Deefgea rivuli]|uniref:alpha/beta hydrolase family protein n=1 Tax=Deefgea rivuli TaxID=400948 RepID=UPI000687FC4A|nr:alpha/beta hydrolase [Deefgea rivuli]
MPYFYLVMVFLLSACGGGGGDAPPATTTAPLAPASSMMVRYGPQTEQYGQFKTPEGNGPFPLAVILHGGCWNRSIASANIMQPMADALTRAGWATLNLEYRVTSDPLYAAPMTFQDVASAMDALPVMLANLPVNLKRTVLIGHSAGGHLALWAAARPSIPSSSVLYTAKPNLPQAVIGLAAIPDLVTYQASSCGSYIPGLRGSLSDAEVSPQAMSSAGVPIYLFSTTADDIVSTQYADAYQKHEASLGHTVSLTTMSGNHFTLIQSSGEVFNAVLKQMNAIPAAP